MNPRTVTWALGALALSFAVVLAVVLLQRPSTGTSTANPPATSAPQTGTTAAPATSPAAEGTDPAEGGPSPLPSSEVEAHDASPGATPYSQTDEARRAWVPVATGFGKAFTTTKGKNAAAWRGPAWRRS